MIYGVTGMPLSGKTTVANILEKQGFTKIDMGNVVRGEMEERDIPTSETGDFVNSIREENGMDAIAQLTLPKIQETKNVVITGMRNKQEKKYFEEQLDTGLNIIALWTSKEVRKQRREERMRKEDREGDEFHERDLRELSNGVGDLIALSDHIIKNEEMSLDELEQEVKQIVK